MQTISGKQYKALAKCSEKRGKEWPAGKFSRPWYDPSFGGLIATNQFIIAAVYLDCGDAPAWCEADPARTLAGDTIVFDAPYKCR
jgi:hypothetical protein